MQTLQRSLFEGLIGERQSRLKGVRASACFVQSSAFDHRPRVDIDINGYQQPYAEAMAQHRIVSWFIVSISPSVDFVSRQVQRSSATGRTEAPMRSWASHPCANRSPRYVISIQRLRHLECASCG